MTDVSQLKENFENTSSYNQFTPSPINGTHEMKGRILQFDENSKTNVLEHTQVFSPPPPVARKPSRNRETFVKKLDDCGGVSICVTEEKETELTMKCQQMESMMNTLATEKLEMEKELTSLRNEAQENRKKMKNFQHKLDRYDNACKARRLQSDLKRWSQTRPSIPDLHKLMPRDELGDSQELIKQFIESERLYLNCLETVDYHFYQPMKMFAIFKNDILSTKQLHALFFNSPQLLVLHRLFYEQLAHLRYIPKDSRLEEFLVILERTAPSFSLYAGFQSEFFMQNLQRELSQCQSKPQFSVLLDNLNQRCEGKTLVDLLRLIAGRLSEYQSLLSPFLEKRVKGTRGMKEGYIKRLQVIIRYLNSIQQDLLDEKCEWGCIVEKLKILNKFSSDSPIPLEIFHPDTKSVKQGLVSIMVKNKEVQKQCLLFTTHIALADKSNDHRFVFTEDAMVSLVGATLYPSVDTAGQIIQPDLHSGLEEDMLGFRINLYSHDPIILRVGRPNEKKSWVENIEKTLEEIQKTQEPDMNSDAIIPNVAPKIAAASLEKLFQHLTDPQIAYKEDFMEVFLNTYLCFTTPKDVLTALLNCIRCPKEKTPDPTTSIQSSTNHVFTFNMDDNADTESISTCLSPSNSMNNLSSGSDSDSSSESPTLSRRGMHPSPTSQQTIKSNQPVKLKNKRTSVSTTDSDSSPYTSGVPISDDVNKEAETGWGDPEMSLIKQIGKQHLETLEEKDSLKTENKTKDLDSFSMDQTSTHIAYNRPSCSRNSNYSLGSLGESDDDDIDTDGHLSRPSLGFELNDPSNKSQLDTESLFQSVNETVKITQELVGSQSSLECMVIEFDSSSQRSVSNCSNEDNSRKHRTQSKMSEDIEEANRLCVEMLNRLDYSSSAKTTDEIDFDDDCFHPEEDEMNYQRYTGRARLSTESPSPNIPQDRVPSRTSCLSLSEPDLVIASLKSERLGTPVRNSGDPDGLLASLPPTVARKFLEPSTPKHSKGHKNDVDNRRNSRFHLGFKSKKTKNASDIGRKSDPSVQSKRYTLNPSSSLYFNSETETQSRSSPSRGLGGIFKKKGKEEKKLKKSESMQCNQTDGSYPDTPKRRPQRSSSVASARSHHIYVNIEDLGTPLRDRMEDGSPKIRRRSDQLCSMAYRNFNLASKIFTVLGKWIDTHFEDFEENDEVMEMLEDFLREMVTNETAESKLAEQVLLLVHQCKRRTSTRGLHFGRLLSRVTDLDPYYLDDFDWEKPSKLIGGRDIDLGKSSNLKETNYLKSFAEQLTLMEFACYNVVRRSELLHCNWKKKDKDILAPNVCRMFRRTNEMTSWICTEVLTRDTPAARAIVLEHFINMAMICYKHNDMHCALCITVALCCTPIKRLAKSWDCLERKAKHKFEKLKDATDHQEKCKKLREKLQRVTEESLEKTNCIPSCIPYLGAYIDQIYSLEIGCKTYNSDGLVNFAKMTKLSSLIDTVLQYQRVRYTFEPKLDIMAYVMSAKRLSENELYDLSVKKEPSKR